MENTIKKFSTLEKLVENNWKTYNLDLQDGEDVLQIISDKKVLMVYAYKGYVEISVGENEGTIDNPAIFPLDVWELREKDFEGMTTDKAIEKFNNIYKTEFYF